MTAIEKRFFPKIDVTQLCEIDRICNSFEKAWVEGSRPRIEDYVCNIDESAVTTVWKELLLIELQRLTLTGQTPNIQDYRDRFPTQSQLIQEEWFTELYAPQLGTGVNINGFVLIREIGRGGSGVVWLAQDEVLQREVAIKFFPPLDDHVSSHGSALYEARVAAFLSHPQIVPVYEKGVFKNREYIVTKYIPGCSLDVWRRLAKPGFEDTARLCAEISQTVHYAHERGITHRDIKPGNIIVDRDGTPYITDFGLAKRHGASDVATVSGQLMGTQGYMSPEQAMGKSNTADCRSDVYSIGAIMYELLTGVKPFSGEFTKVMRATIRCNPTRPRRLNPSIPQLLENICLKCLRKRPDLRFATAELLAESLRSVRQTDSAVLMPTHFDALRDRLHVNRRKVVAILAVSGLAALWQSTQIQKSSEVTPISPVRVKVSAVPPNSEMVIIGLNSSTGAFIPSTALYTTHASSYEVELVPGDYYITARIGDRFHEVYRHVPSPNDAIGIYSRPTWQWKADERGAYLKFDEIVIPETTVTNGMALVTTNRAYELESSIKSSIRRVGKPASFYVDTAEFTESDFIKAVGMLPTDRSFTARGASYPIRVAFDYAMRAAEKAGKRLADEVEYEYMATDGYTKAFPWGNNTPPDGATETIFGVAGSPSFDVVTFDDTPVYGLASNVAEWTMSRPTGIVGPDGEQQWEWQFPVNRIVRGGALDVVKENPQVTPKLRNTLVPTIVRADSWQVGLGFRCVRSMKPKWHPEDFA